MITLIVLFLALCIAMVLVERIKAIHNVGIRLNVLLLTFSLMILSCWWIARFNIPHSDLRAQTGMVYLSLVGFLSMVLSLASAIRNLNGLRLGIVAGLSFIVGLVHLFDIIVSMPSS